MTTVVVQRGHVPRTSGATGAPGEQQFARDTASALAPMLRAMGLTVRVIDADVDDELYRGDVFVAIHYDSATSSSASGASVGYQSAEGKRFADIWKRCYAAQGWTRPFRADNYSDNLGGYYGVRNAIGQGNRAAIITESGFHSNAGDKAMMSPARTARSIAAAVGELLGKTPEDDMPTAKEVAAEIMSYRLDDPLPADSPLATSNPDDKASFGSIVRYEWMRGRQVLAVLGKLQPAIVEAVRAELADADIEVAEGVVERGAEKAVRKVLGTLDEVSEA